MSTNITQGRERTWEETDELCEGRDKRKDLVQRTYVRWKTIRKKKRNV
jgi:hypothetical protein